MKTKKEKPNQVTTITTKKTKTSFFLKLKQLLTIVLKHKKHLVQNQKENQTNNEQNTIQSKNRTN